MVWDGVDEIWKIRVEVGIVFVLSASWIVCDVEELVVEVFGVSDAVFVVAGVPDFSWGLLARGEGVRTFDVLNAFCG